MTTRHLSMRAVARAIGSAATSVYLHFADRDALVLAALNRRHEDLMQAIDDAQARQDDPVSALRARTLILGEWAYRHPGLYKVLHDHSQSADRDGVQAGVCRPHGRRGAAVYGS
ncbi:TetR family transcriptional regulator [Nocardia sp. NPDC049190]|uniref:TetR/AcrR family transcriptional regulator n=1 Tax=Nocardia sp. NPDC049190 TaxID=3155650 RepID=UPI0033D27ABA